MDGLECSEVMLKYVLCASDIFRLDSFFYAQNFIYSEKLIEKGKHIVLKKLAFSIRSFGAYSLNNEVTYKESGIPFIRGVNMKNGVIDFSDTIYITEYANKLLLKSQVFPENILLSMSGTIGEVGIALPGWNYPINSNQDIAKITIDDSLASPYYVYAFLRSKYGQNYLIREARGSVQQHVFLSQMELFKVPLFSDGFTSQIRDIVITGFTFNEKSKQVYYDAEKLLLSELGMTNFSPSSNNIAVKSFMESFGKSGRLDAEFYQPKYDYLLRKLNHFHVQFLGGQEGLVNIKKSIEPGSDAYNEEGIPFIRVSDVSKYGIANPEIRLSPDIVENIKSLYPQKDTILFSKDGSVGIAYKMESDTEVITSGALLHLVAKDTSVVLPDYLTLVLNSIVVQLQAERDSSGAIIQHWKPSEIEKVIIPILDMSIQLKIAKRVQESFTLRRLSEQLLESAKKAVEIAIEHGEDKALDFLRQH